MGSYAYCVVPIAHYPPAGLTGLDGASVEYLAAGPVGVWVSRMSRPQPGVALLQAHNDVVEAAITEQVTPVPLRFGQWLAEEAQLVAGIEEKAARYVEQLEQFAGCLEFGLRFLDPSIGTEARDVHPAGPISGYEYMQALAANSKLADQIRRQAEEVRERVGMILGHLIRAQQEEKSDSPHAVLTLSHLVARPHLDEYREQARSLRTDFPALRMLLSGPWPPYSFAA
ncbi:MAG TPA: GvpL/GvpF family gas vesicle protein [Longimicrobiales bacterium]